MRIKSAETVCTIDKLTGTSVHRALKLLSEDPAHYPDAPREGIRRVLEQVLKQG